jgi:hypothetical protein
MAWPYFVQARNDLFTDVLGIEAPWMERATGRRIYRIGRLASKNNLVADLTAPGAGNVGHEGFRVRMPGASKELFGRPLLHHPPDVHYHDVFAEMPYQSKVMRD